MTVSAADRHQSVLPPAEEYSEVGFNFRMTDLQAAVGLVQLSKLPAIVRRRREIATRYRAGIRGLAGLRTVADPDYGTGNIQSFWIEVQEEYPTDRDGLLIALAEAGVSARRGIMATHRQAPYRDLAAEGSLPATEWLTDNTLILPVYHSLSNADQDRVIDVLLHPVKEVVA